MIRVDDVEVIRDRKPLLSAVSCEFLPGEFVCVVGPNGAGKSTLLRTVAGELRADRGRVTIDGTDLGRMGRGALARRRAVVTQEIEIAFPFTVLDIVMLGRIPHGAGPATSTDLTVAREALALLGVNGFADRPISTLSGGERQRVHIARALAQIWRAEEAGGDRYLLLDEPTSAMDIAHQLRVLEIAKRLTRESVGVIAIVHDLSLAAGFADKVVLLAEGSVAAIGGPESVFDAGRLESVFGVDCEILPADAEHWPSLRIARRAER